MKIKKTTILKIISISCFMIAAIIGIVSKEYISGIAFLLMAIGYLIIFLSQKKSIESK